MKIVFASNYLNHHQLPLCKAFNEISEVEFTFIAVGRTPKFRLELGYEDLADKYDFVLSTCGDKSKINEAFKLCEDADVVIIGGAPDKLIEKRLKQKKLTFRASERIFKEKLKLWEWPLRVVKYANKYSHHKNLYLLCYGGYVSRDYAISGAFIGKAYKWGYFPETKRYDDIDSLISKKEENSILWVGRLIDLKHPEQAIEVAERLKKAGHNFTLNIIGEGILLPELIRSVSEKGLENNVKFLGSMPPEKVREYMEKSEIFMFTSDRNEGWGAVLNEAMNSGCAVISSDVIGATPFLIKDNENGFVYKHNNVNSLYDKTVSLIKNKEYRKSISKKAYYTISKNWNAEIAAERFVELSKTLLNGKSKSQVFNDGVCSKAESLRDSRYKV